MKNDNPHVYVPPPLIYLLIFLLALWLQQKFPIDSGFRHLAPMWILGMVFLIGAAFFLSRSVSQFFKTKNTLITVRPANSLQTGGIYALSRNPMYIGATCVYLTASCFWGNWWNIILLPVIIIIIQEYVIKREEKYLERAFGNEYLDYKKQVRRWL